jgi:uncharacterized cupredoxin-like copper-binding protein
VTGAGRAAATLLAGLVGAPLLGGCAAGDRAIGGSAADTERPPTSITLPFGVQEVVLTIRDFRHDPSEINVVAGSRIVITARNASGRLHNVTLLDPDQALVVSVDVPPGESHRIDLTPGTPGAYLFFCNQLGHRPLGEQGVVRVRPRF